MPAVTIIRARGDGFSEPLGQRHISVLPQEGHYVTLKGAPYFVEAVIHSLDRNRILVRVRAIDPDPEPEPQVIEAPQLQVQVQQLPALPPAPEIPSTDDDWVYK